MEYLTSMLIPDKSKYSDLITILFNDEKMQSTRKYIEENFEAFISEYIDEKTN